MGAGQEGLRSGGERSEPEQGVPARAPLGQAHRSIFRRRSKAGVGPFWAPITTPGGRRPGALRPLLAVALHHREAESSPTALRVHDDLAIVASDGRLFREDELSCGSSAPRLYPPLQRSQLAVGEPARVLPRPYAGRSRCRGTIVSRTIGLTSPLFARSWEASVLRQRPACAGRRSNSTKNPRQRPGVLFDCGGVGSWLFLRLEGEALAADGGLEHQARFAGGEDGDAVLVVGVGGRPGGGDNR